MTLQSTCFAKLVLASVLAAMAFGMMAEPAAAQYDPSQTYINRYNSARSLSGSSLANRLGDISNDNFNAISFDDVRFTLDDLWRDPNNSNNLIQIYTGNSVSGDWDFGATWNREHIWPTSRFANNSGSAQSDLLNLAPSNPRVNSDRGNKHFGSSTTDTTFFPGAQWQGNVARATFYMAVRYNDFSLRNGTPSGDGRLGDLGFLMQAHFADAPDDFERRMNHLNNTGIPGDSSVRVQGNRNPFIDRPEFAYATFVDNQNNSQIQIAGSSSNNNSTGESTLNLNQRVIQNGSIDSQNVQVNKNGNDGTYYSVTTTGIATSSESGRYNAFEHNTQDSTNIVVGALSGVTSTTGRKTGSVTIDNLDITTGGGNGRGDQDANDVINLNVDVLSQRSVTGTEVALGQVIRGATVSGSSQLSTSGSDQERTRINVATTANDGSVSATGNGTRFDAASDTGTRDFSATFAAAGEIKGELEFQVSSAEAGGGLAGEGAYESLSIDYSATVFDVSNASGRATSDLNEILIDFGSVDMGIGTLTEDFDIFNLESTADFTSTLDLDSFVLTGADAAALSTDLALFSSLGAGESESFSAMFDTSNAGFFSELYTLSFSDMDIAGETTNSLTLRFQGTVVAIPEPGSAIAIGMFSLVWLGRRRRSV